MTADFLEEAPTRTQDAAKLVDVLHRLERANLIGTIGFEERIDIAYEMGELLERLDSYRLRVRG